MSMSNKSIEAIIDRLNSGDCKNIFLQQISEDVEYGIAWHKVNQIHPIKGNYQRELRDLFYFIKDEKHSYVGAVLIMVKLDDLHAFVKKEHRRQGYLSNAMTRVILPHLLRKKERQRITIDNDWLSEKKYNISKKSALRIGFKVISDNEFFITIGDIELDKEVQVQKYGMKKERMLELSEKMKEISIEIRKIEDEFEMKLGKMDLLEELRVFAEDMGNRVLEEEYFELKNNSNSS